MPCIPHIWGAQWGPFSSRRVVVQSTSVPDQGWMGFCSNKYPAALPVIADKGGSNCGDVEVVVGVRVATLAGVQSIPGAPENALASSIWSPSQGVAVGLADVHPLAGGSLPVLESVDEEGRAGGIHGVSPARSFKDVLTVSAKVGVAMGARCIVLAF